MISAGPWRHPGENQNENPRRDSGYRSAVDCPLGRLRDHRSAPPRHSQAPADPAVLSLDVATVARRGAGAAQPKAPGILSQFFWSLVAALSSECVGSGTDRWIRAAVPVHGLGGDSLRWPGNLSHG